MRSICLPLQLMEEVESMDAVSKMTRDELLGLFADSATEYAIVLTRADGRIAEWSSGAEAMLGWTAQEALGQPIALIFTPEDCAAGVPDTEIDTARRTGRANDTRWHLKKDGTRFFVDAVTHAIVDPDGSLAGFGKVMRDLTARKLAHDAAQVKASLFDLAYDAIFTWSIDSGLIHYWNRGATELYGYDRAAALGQAAHQLLGTVFPAGLHAVHDALRRTRRWEGELNHQLSDGSRIQVQSRMVLRTDLGKAPQVLEINRDITRQKRAEQSLRDSEERFRLLVMATSQIVWRTDPAGRLIEDSPLWRAFTGQTLEQMRDFGWLDAIHPDDRSRTLRDWNRSVTHRSMYEIEYRLRRADGAWRWVATRAVPLLHSNGAIREWMGTVTDVTEMREATEQRRTSEERLRLATEAAELGIWTWDTAHDIGYWDNDRMYAIFGFERTDVPLNLARAMAEACYPDDAPGLRDALQGAAASGERMRFEGRFFRRNDHAVRWVELTGHTAYDHGGEAKRIIGTAADVTERKDVEEELRRLAADLSESNRRKTEFLAVLAHELRNPLAPIRAGLDVMRLSGDQPDTVSRVRAMMQRQLTHIVRLIDDLLDVARINSGKIELKKQRIALGEVVDTVVETSLPAVEGAGQHLAVDLPDTPLWLDADPTRLAQVLSNLLINASKYTPAGGRIRLQARQEGDSVRIALSDTGIGIAREALSTVFHMFAQGRRHGAEARAQAGLGIGLSIVRTLVELHGGTVKACSDGPGRGSTFTVRLPLAKQPAPAVLKPADAVPKGAACPRHRILIADDNADAAQALSDLLKFDGHETQVAYDGLQALHVAHSFHPDVMLLDIGMPGLDGYGVARAVRRLPPEQQATLIALTGWGAEDDRLRSQASGFDFHLTKPVELASLSHLLQTIKSPTHAAQT